ncbi:MAG TPA: glycosyltransferase family 2 protein [Gammaproteobacteria bacterium]|nr:glycosyltransferase family 2 protein [Gammaproteobacteria bacterium]
MNLNPADIRFQDADQDTELPTPELSIVIPLFNETPMLSELFARLETTISSLSKRTEVILVDDGSSDSTWLDITHYAPQSFSTRCFALSRNFGKEAALTAGLHAASGQAVVILDADCQDPPELIPEMLQHWAQGAGVVNMKRRSRDGESWLKRKTSSIYYRLLGMLSEVPIPANVGDFRLLDRRVVDEINRLGERNRYMKGLLAWPGFNQVTLEYDRQPRVSGNSKWNYWQLSGLAISGITAFSNKPLRIASWMGLMVALSAFAYGLWILLRTLLYGDPVSGYPTMMLVILFLGGIQLMTIGILGEYIGRVFTEVKNRPNYIIRDSYDRDGSSVTSQIRAI